MSNVRDELIELHDRSVAEYNETGNEDLLGLIAETELLMIAFGYCELPKDGAA